MTRAELVQQLVLAAISDDFENGDQVNLRDVAARTAMCGFTVQRADIVEVLTGLVEGGLAKAYDLVAAGPDPFSGELPGMPRLDVVEEDFRTYFYATEKGLEALRSQAASWPFDGEGLLRPGCEPAEA
ncbi:MAG: hypothetical protein JST11_19925 [Acidobacteria bacterium]|nr:hypothetical protein [Acidobacteriota bacterium]